MYTLTDISIMTHILFRLCGNAGLRISARSPISAWLRMTAWPMETPRPYSFFHLAFCIFGITAAYWLAARLTKGRKNHVSPDYASSCRILFCCGLILAAGEIYKQAFLYYVVYAETYNWWYFPFQLCSMPMYLCLLLPLFIRKEPMFRTVCTFLRDFSLLGGIMALAEPSGLMHPYWTLTVHGLMWHVILIFIGLFLAMTETPYRTFRSYFLMLPLLAVFCLIATGINIATGGAADMFYISPYYPVTQIVFHELSLQLGTGAGIAIYLACLCTGGLICHLLAPLLIRRSK